MSLIIILVLLIFYCYSNVCLGEVAAYLLTKNFAPLPDKAGLTRFASRFLLGQGFLASIWIIAGLLAVFTPAFIMVTLVICILITIPFRLTFTPIISVLQHLKRILTDLSRESVGWKIIAVLVPIVICMTFFQAFAMPSWDATVFYLAFPKLAAATGRITPLAGFEGYVVMFGLQSEMHFAALLALGTDTLARLYVWPTSLVTALLLAALGTQVGVRRRGQWMILAAVYTSTTFLNLTGDGKIDVFSAAMGLAAFYYVMLSNGGENAGATRLTGLFMGFSVMAKLTYVGTLVPGVMVLFLWQYLARQPKNRAFKPLITELIIRVFWLGIWSVLPLIPLLLKILILFGQVMTPSVIFELLGQHLLSAEGTRRALLTYPFALVFGTPVATSSYGDLSVLPLAFAPLILFAPRPKNLWQSKLAPLSLAALVCIILWMIFGTSVLVIRYMFSPLFVLYLAPILVAEYVSSKRANLRLLGGVVTFSVIFTLVITLPKFRNDLYSFAQYNAGHTLNCDDDGGWSCVLLSVNQDAANGDRVFAVSDPSYWLRPDLLQCLSSRNETQAVWNLPDMTARWNYVYEHGFRYFIIDHQYANVFNFSQIGNPLDLQHLPDGLKLVQIFDKPDVVAAYRLDWGNRPVPPTLTCHQVDAQRWQVGTLTASTN